MQYDVAARVTPASLADYTQPSLIVPSLRERDAAGIISELGQVLQREGFVPDFLPFYHAALNQELMANSGQDCGMAFPHARAGGVKQLQFAFGRAPDPVTWGPKGSWPVRLVFLLAVPATDAVNYLQVLASLARLEQKPEVLARLRAAPDSAGILAILESIGLGKA